MFKVIFKSWLFCFFLGIISFQQGVFANESNVAMNDTEFEGKRYFEGNRRLKNGGVACISCHSVQSNSVTYGGLLAKDLTDVYSRMGEGISAWLMAPPFPAMEVSYKNNPLTESERERITAFLKYVNDNQSEEVVRNGKNTMLIAGGGGVLVMVILVSLIWMDRKKKMVKEDIFTRQIKAKDAKF